jgi:hypothetical protein
MQLNLYKTSNKMDKPETKSRPALLTWLCIGSAVFGISWIIMFLVLITCSVRGNIPAGLFPGLVIEYLKAGYLFISAEILLTGLGIIGVILMWQMQKSGLFLYAITKVMIYFLPVVFIGNNHLTYLGLTITSIFILVYGIIITGALIK